MLHGDAVGHGLRFALRLSIAEGCDRAGAARVERLLDRLALPPLPALDAEALMARIGRDKKARSAGVGWVLLATPGAGRSGVRLPEEGVRSALVEFLGDAGSSPL